MAFAAAARSTAAVVARAAAARHVASDVGRFSPLFPRRGFAAGTTLPAARTRPLPSDAAASPPVPPLSQFHEEFYYHGSENYVPICWFNPEAPEDPATIFNYGEEDLASDEAMWALYERWCVFYGVKRGRDDMLRRFGGFKDRARSIHEFNKSGASSTWDLNERADLTAEERTKFCGVPEGLEKKK